MSHPRFKISHGSQGQYTFNLTAENSEVLLASERYASHAGAAGGIESVRANAPLDERYERRTSHAKQPYFVLKAANGEVIATSEMYSSTSARDEGIRSVMKNAVAARVEG